MSLKQKFRFEVRVNGRKETKNIYARGGGEFIRLTEAFKTRRMSRMGDEDLKVQLVRSDYVSAMAYGQRTRSERCPLTNAHLLHPAP